MRLIYDNATRRTHSVDGVHIDAPYWGSTEGVEFLDPKEPMFNKLVERLVDKLGYVRDVTLRAAPYDSRRAPSEFNHRWAANLRGYAHQFIQYDLYT